MLPFFEVSHLPASASFYSAILQPLGLVYISPAHAGELTPPTSSSSSTSPPSVQGTALVKQPAGAITFGTSNPPTPLLELRQVTQPKRSHAVLSVPSPGAIAESRAFAFRANPADPAFIGRSLTGITPDAGGEARCRISDLDGNTMDMVYMPDSSQSARGPGSVSGQSIQRPPQDESSRILSWNYDVAASEHDPAPAPLAGPSEPYTTILRRSITTSTIEGVPREAPPATTDNGAGAGATILGALLGAAAGAALTYGVMRSERERAPRQEFEAPPVVRRATYPDRMPHAQAHAPAPYPGGRYVEVERTVEKIRYPENYGPLAEHRSPPQYLAKYSQTNMPPRSRAMDDMYDDIRSRRSSHHQSRAPSTRSRSLAPEDPRVPLMLMDHEHRSNAGSRHTAKPSKPPSVRTRSYDTTDRETYVSARSRRSSSTVKGPPPPTVETELAVRSRASSRAPSKAPSKAPSARAPSVREPTIVSVREADVARQPSIAPSRAASKAASRAGPGPGSAVLMTGGSGGFPPNASRTPSHVSARNIELPMSRVGSSHVSARHIGLPVSGIGSSHAGWDDDNVSVAPSDSISCVGSKMSRRRYNA